MANDEEYEVLDESLYDEEFECEYCGESLDLCDCSDDCEFCGGRHYEDCPDLDEDEEE